MNHEQAEQLIRTLSESRSVEVKRWFDPQVPSGKAKLIKGLQALRNYDGGSFVVGFLDETMLPDGENRPNDVVRTFNGDQIQELLARHSSEPFEVKTLYPEMAGQMYVVVSVPSGVVTPVAVKRPLNNGSGHNLIDVNDVFFRTINSNNRVSSAKIPYADLPELLRIFFENREADIGRFLRRHLSSLDGSLFQRLAENNSPSMSSTLSADQELDQLLDDGEARYLARVGARSLDFPEHGSFEVALILNGVSQDMQLNDDFLRLLDSSNPRLTGWPIWLNSTGFHERDSRPYVLDGGWEALIASFDNGWVSDYLDFMRKEPSGHFYLRRALQDDLTRSDRAPPPLSALDFGLTILRVAEAIAVGKAFARAMGYSSEDTVLEFAFRWKGLNGRKLSSWANPTRSLSMDRVAIQDVVVSRVSVPLEAAPEMISIQTNQVVSKLFSAFEGFEISASVVDDFVTRLLERRL